MAKFILAAVAIAIFLSACGTSQVAITYSPDPAMKQSVPAMPVVAVGSVTDSRQKDPYRLGVIRGGYGNTVKTIDTEKPVSEVVKSALTDALAANGLLATNKPKYLLNADIIRFDCNQYVRREAHIVLQISLVNAISGKVSYTKKLTSDAVMGSIITLETGIFAPVDDMRKVADEVLQDAIDQLLNDPAFRASLG